MDAFLQFSLQKKDFILFLFFLVQEAFCFKKVFVFVQFVFVFVRGKEGKLIHQI